MKRNLLVAFLTMSAVFGTTTSHVFAGIERIAVSHTHTERSLAIPERAVEVAPGVFSLGESVDPEHGDVVEGYMIVHPRKGNGKPTGTPGGGGSTASSCYAFMAKDAKWKTVEPWVVNPANTFGMSDAFVLSTLTAGIGTWETAANANILGNGSITTNTLVADEVAMDLQNEVYFSALDSGTIGVTIVWGVFGGPTQGRELREWDQIYNTYYTWGDALVDVSVMDFRNIATHELGHAMGLADLYQSECSNETMFGYGTEGETKKRELNPGDVIGINKLY